MLARTGLVLLCLLLAVRANASGEESPPTPSQLCRQNIANGRSIWLHDLFDAPPDVSALMVAVIDGKVSQALQKLEELPPNESARWRQTALLTAAFAEQPAMTEALLRDGAAVDGRGWKPAYKPAFFDYTVDAMKHDPRFGGAKAVDGMKASAVLNNQRQDLGTALGAATSCDDSATVGVLLRHHANPGTRLGPEGADVLLIAIINGNATIVRALLDHGVNVCADDRLARQVRNAYDAKHPGYNTRPLLTYAQMGRRANLPDEVITRLICTAYDTASTPRR